MWKRLRRRSLAPSGQAAFPYQWAAIAAIFLLVIGTVAGVVWVLYG